MHETSARTWCTGKTWKERVEREVEGGIGMGNTCKPMAVSFQCMTKFTTKKKKIYNLRVKFYLGQNEDCSPGGSISDSSETLLQSGSGGKSIYKVLVKGEFSAMKLILQKIFVSQEDLMSP